MSTRSYIAIKTKEGNYKGSYCHWDGYVSHNGALLVDHYNTYDKAIELINLGSLSCLRPNVNPNPNQEHSFEHPQEDVCVFYGRDRGEKNQESKEFGSKKELLDYFNNSWCDYIYIFENNKWWVSEIGNIDFEDVNSALEKEYEKFGIKRLKGYYGYLTQDIVDKIQQELKA